jgi:hypothetical protein
MSGSGKVYTEEILTMLIEVANQYIDDPGIRKGLVSKCYQEIGMLFAGASGKTTIDLDNRESMALKSDLMRQRLEKQNSTASRPG